MEKHPFLNAFLFHQPIIELIQKREQQASPVDYAHSLTLWLGVAILSTMSW